MREIGYLSANILDGGTLTSYHQTGLGGPLDVGFVVGISPPLGHLQQNGDTVQLIKMYLLYLDESGTHSSARHFVLAGVAILETEVAWVKAQLDNLQSQYLPDYDGGAHFHAAELRRKDDGKIEHPGYRLIRRRGHRCWLSSGLLPCKSTGFTANVRLLQLA